MRARHKIAAGVIFLAACAASQAQIAAFQATQPEVWVQVRMEATGEASIQVWPDIEGRNLAQGAADALHCKGVTRIDPDGPGTIRCSKALSRDGLALEGVVDLAPIARRLDPSDRIELLLNFPRLGLESVSIPMEDRGGEARIVRTARFSASDLPPPIHIRFGYHPRQLSAIFLPLGLLALALALAVAVLSRAGLAGLSRSILVLGMILWMGAASALHLEALVQILLFGSPNAGLAALFLVFWPPLFCVAAGVAIGSEDETGWKPIAKFREIFGGFAVIPLAFTCAIGVLPSMMANDWLAVAPWLAAAPLFVLARRQWIRKFTGASVKQLSEGELNQRILALAAKAGRPKIKVYISYSARSQPSAAFTLPGKSIYLTAQLVRSLSKREVDAVAAHELSHTGAFGRGLWTALGVAMVLFEFPLREILLPGTAGICVAILIPLAIFFLSLRNARRHEFAADAGSAALCGDPRAMIASLARVSRNNGTPLEWNAVVECFAPHPSTHKRLLALAASARIDAAELAALCANDDLGERYELPQETPGQTIFTPQWQKNNAGVYSWAVMFTCSGVGLLAAWLLHGFTGAGAVQLLAQLLAGIVLGCAITKGLAATLMAGNYARLRRKLATKLGVGGQLVGLAVDSQPRLYNGFRFSDAGLLRFESGRLCYQSERTTIALNPADLVDVSMVAASPSTWFRLQPMVRFRQPGSGDVSAFILHPVDWLPTQRRLLRSVKQWAATQASPQPNPQPTPQPNPQPTSTSGFNASASQPFRKPSIAAVARAFLLSGGVTLVAAISARSALHAEWWYVGYALAVTACAHTFMFLPALLYRPPLPSPESPPPANAS